MLSWTIQRKMCFNYFCCNSDFTCPTAVVMSSHDHYLESSQCSCCSCFKEEEASSRLLFSWWTTSLLLYTPIRSKRHTLGKRVGEITKEKEVNRGHQRKPGVKNKTMQNINIHQLVVNPFRIRFWVHIYTFYGFLPIWHSQMEKLIKEICKSKMHVWDFIWKVISSVFS